MRRSTPPGGRLGFLATGGGVHTPRMRDREQVGLSDLASARPSGVAAMDDKEARAWRKSYGMPEDYASLMIEARKTPAYVIDRRNVIIRAQLRAERGTYPRYAPKDA